MSNDTYNNVTVIEEKSGIILIDTFMKKETMTNFLNLVNEYNKPIKSVILTHWHIDHSLGAFFLKGKDVYSSRECKSHLEDFVDQHQDRLRKLGIIEEGVSIIMPNKVFDRKLVLQMEDDEKLILESLPGHSFDSIILSYKDILIVGDAVVGKEIELFIPPVIPPDAKKTKSEDLLKAVKHIEDINPKYIIYGHGKRVNPKEVIKDNLIRITELMKS